MELRQLRYFVAIARDLNFTRAADKLRVAQPALSRQVRQLEEELGVELLNRGARGVQLTAAGKTLLEQATALLDQSERAAQLTRISGQRRRVELNVGYVWGLFHSSIPKWVAQFRRQHPDVAVNLLDVTATQQAQALKQRKLDVGLIGFAFESDRAALMKRKIGRCSFMAALPQRHSLAKKRVVALADLARDFFIVISDDSYPGAARFLREACRGASFRPKVLQTAERGYTILGLVAANCGVTLLPDSLQDLPHPGVVFRPLKDAPQGDLFVSWNRDGLLPAAQAFVDSIAAPDDESNRGLT